MKFSGNNHPYLILATLTTLFALGTLIGILLPYQDMMAVQILRIVSGSVFILFLPGYFLTKVFFRDTEIDVLERFALSFALSIAVVPLLVFYTNLLGLPITALTVYGITCMIIILSSITLAISHRRLGTQNKRSIHG